MTGNSMLGKHAIVLGGNIAGLLAARVLTEHFENVSLIERDHYPDDPVLRPGVPQARHIHNYALSGQQIVEELFPGIKYELIARGAIEIDLQDYSVYESSRWQDRMPSQLYGYTCPLYMLEWQIRHRLSKSPQIHCIDGHEVVELVASKDAKSIIGVSLLARPNARNAKQAFTEITADLVVDATGRESKAPQWLKSLGYAPPSETIIDSSLGYASRLYEPSFDPQRDWKVMAIKPDIPRNLRGGIIWPTQDGHWIVGLTGAGKEYPPTKNDAFLEFARSLSHPALFEAIKDARPLSPIYGYRHTENRFRHFEFLRRQPERFLIIGDAACISNPIHGQGMMIAALGAITLRECLCQARSNDLSQLAPRFQRKLARTNAFPWSIATAADMRVPGVEGTTRIWIKKGQCSSHPNNLLIVLEPIVRLLFSSHMPFFWRLQYIIVAIATIWRALPHLKTASLTSLRIPWRKKR